MPKKQQGSMQERTQRRRKEITKRLHKKYEITRKECMQEHPLETSRESMQKR